MTGQAEISAAPTRAERSSNLELMRIILMLLIVAHHSVVNSGVMDLWDMSALTANAVVLELWGMWGKVCINAFVMITGYFMCTKRLTWVKVAKLLLQIFLYKLVIGGIFLAVGLMDATAFVKSFVGPLRSVDGGFTASFLVMYLSIPFLNKLLESLDRGGVLRLLTLLLWVQVFVTTFLVSSSAFSEVAWYITLYFVAAYIRLYPARWMSSARVAGWLFLACVLLSMASVCCIMGASVVLGISGNYAYYFVNDSGKILAFLTGVSCFLWFKNLRMPHVPVINSIAATTFGVFLIHANSDAMRAWLWGDVFNICGLYQTLSPLALLGAEVLIMLVVFAACSAIDMLRIRFVEKPLFNWVYANQQRIEQGARRCVEPLVRLGRKVLG